MKNITPLILGGILIFLHSQTMSGPLELDWTASTTGGAAAVHRFNGSPTPWPGAASDDGDPRVQCSGAAAAGCQFNTHYPSTTAFRYDIFVVDGVKYAETKVGDENTGFVQQSVVRVGGVGSAPTGLGPAPILSNFSTTTGTHSGGQPGSKGNGDCSLMTPGTSAVCVSDTLGSNNLGALGGGFDPLGLFVKPLGGHVDVEDSGSGTNNPTTAIIRMVIKDAEFEQAFLKDSFNYKPQITSTLTTPEMSIHVSMDMRAIDYNTLNANAPFVNTLTFTNPADSAANFNHATDAQTADVTAGQFIYLPQGGWISPTIASNDITRRIDFRAGFYLQPDGGGFNVYDNDVYGFFRNPAQNGGALTGVPPCGPGSCILPAFATD